MRARLAIVAWEVEDAARAGGSNRLLVFEREQLLGRPQTG